MRIFFRLFIALFVFLFPFVVSDLTVANNNPPVARIKKSVSFKESQKSILFIGNSYIYTNDLPQIFSNLVQSAGFEVKIDSSTNPGWKLQQHAQSKNTLRLLKSQRWDYVIVQEQSQLPLNSLERKKSMLPAVRLLQEYAREQGTVVVLMMTWAHKNGWPEAGFNRFKDMQEKLTQVYFDIGSQLGLKVIPVGTAWKNALMAKPYYPLWQQDGSHPSLSGAYLTACVLFKFLYHQSPKGLSYTAGLSQESSAFLQEIADLTVE